MSEQIDKYVIDKFLGNGAYGDVYLAFDIEEGISVAIKRVEKLKLMDDDGYADQLLQQEITVLQSINSQNVVRLIEALESQREYFLIFEYCNGGDLWGHWEKNNYRFSESDAIAYMRQILNGLKDLHQLNVIHRDLKLPNILINDNQLKIGDLGFAKFLNVKEEKCFEAMGTLGNMAPEVMEFKPYGLAADMFSLGTMFYQMLYSDYPFRSDSFESFIIDVKNDSPKFDKQDIQVSPEAKDVLKKMLKYNPDDRIPWEDLYVHPIFQDHLDSSYEALNMNQLIAQQVNLESNRQVYVENKSKFQNLKHTTKFDFLNPLIQNSKLKQLPKVSESLLKKMQAMSKVTQQLFQLKQNADQLRHNPQVVRHQMMQVLQRYINKLNIIRKLKEVIATAQLLLETKDQLNLTLSKRQESLFTSVQTGQNIFNFEFFEQLIKSPEYLTLQRIIQQEVNQKYSSQVQFPPMKNSFQTSLRDIFNKDSNLLANPIIQELINMDEADKLPIPMKKI